MYDFPFLWMHWRLILLGARCIHIATAGGVVSKDVYENPVHFQIRKKVKNLPSEMKMEWKLNPYLDEIFAEKKKFNNEEYAFDEESYKHDFIEYAKCGFFSFDRTNLNDPSDSKYHLVAYPVFNENYNELARIIFNDEIGNFNYTMVNKYLDEIVNDEIGRAGIVLDMDSSE
ncbi:hypothetical protein [Chromobacterium sp. ASV23]|uniref:hypothetical protein n=1 Tax=Chromobacterium sp. ASV23 TaxID=2795110 RepID=UPI0018ED913A|nr:hypothetical protein [Chromobacterium sp. ASV23]